MDVGLERTQFLEAGLDVLLITSRESRSRDQELHRIHLLGGRDPDLALQLWIPERLVAVGWRLEVVGIVRETIRIREEPNT